MQDWWIYKGTNEPREKEFNMPKAPPWRQFKDAVEDKGKYYEASPEEIELVNAALYLRRPLLITGKPGTGKSSLAYSVAHELNLGKVLLWPITTRSTIQDGLYQYDAIARLRDSSFQLNIKEISSILDQSRNPTKNIHNSSKIPSNDHSHLKKFDIGKYIRLGPLGTALLPGDKPRVLLIDEIDKSDLDFPNNLLHVFEEGMFEIPELVRLSEDFPTVEVSVNDDGKKATIIKGKIETSAKSFPLIILTSNGEKEFPPAFLRRCLQHEIKLPDDKKLLKIIKNRFKITDEELAKLEEHVKYFLKERDDKHQILATDQLLNVIFLTLKGIDPLQRDKETLLNALLKALGDARTL